MIIEQIFSALVDAGFDQSFRILGLLFLVLGVIFLAVPFLSKLVPSIEKLPPILFWVYKKDGFYFATSPILIIISVISVLLYLLKTR